MAVWIALVTLDQLRSAECKVACGFIGFEGGIYWRDNCYCFEKKDYYELTNRKRIYLPKKSKESVIFRPTKEETQATSSSQSSGWSYRGYPKEEEYEIP